MLTWETNHPPELKGKWKYNDNQGAVKLILDGQQRITTLYMLIRGDLPPYYKPEEITQQRYRLGPNNAVGNVFVWVMPADRDSFFSFTPENIAALKLEAVIIDQPHCAKPACLSHAALP